MTTKKTSTAVAVNKGNEVATADAMAQMRAMIEANAKKTAPVGGNAIRITQDKNFVLPDGSKIAEVQVVIVDFTSRNEYYNQAFDKNNIRPPTCFAIGEIPSELVPSANSPERQADSCASCPMNVFGSDGAGKACKNTRMLAVLPPDSEDDTPIWTIKVSPTAIKGFDGYVKNVQRMFGVPPVGVVTTISFEPSVDHAQLKFSDPVPNEVVGRYLDRFNEAKEILATEPDVSTYDISTPATARKAVGRRPTTIAARR